jgi:hypothetical protein
LCLKAQARAALPSRGNPKIRDKLALSHDTAPHYVSINER